MADPAVNNDFSSNAAEVGAQIAASEAVAQNADSVDDATAAIETSLSSGFLNPITNSDIRDVQATLTSLEPRDATAAFENLSDSAVDTLVSEINDWRPGNLGGLSDTQKQDFFNDMARVLDGAQLTRLSEAFGGEQPGTNADVGALGQAIADHATPNTKADFVESLAERGLIAPGSQPEAGFGSTTTRESSVYTDSALAVLGSLSGEASAFDRAIGALDDGQLTTLVQSGLGATTKDPLVGFSSTEYQADNLAQLQTVAESTGSVETRAGVLSKVNTAIDSLVPRDEVTLSSGGTLEKSIVPSIPPSAAQVAATQAELAQQQTRIENLRAVGTPEATALADELEARYHGEEVAKLAADVYHWVGEGVSPSAPVGWTRVSEDPAALARYGLTQANLAPANSGFRAELYVPDPAIHGADAQPVLAFKGTTASSAEDWSNNFGQGTGNRTDYYDRAMALAVKVDRATDGNFEVTGHSLGGGMASAASAVTGATGTTYNSAGLHPNTANEFIARSGMGTPVSDTSQNVTVYQVEGEILTTLQSSASGIDPQRADQIGNVVRFAAGVASNPFIEGQVEQRVGAIGDFGVLANAQGSDLLSMAEAVGQPVALNALDVTNATPAQDAAQFVGPDGLATRADTILDRMDARIAASDAAAADQPWYAPPGSETVASAAGRVQAYRAAYGEYQADPVLTGAGDALSESVARHGMDYVDRGIDQVLDGLEAQADTLLGR
ncbi:MAG: hypothetical protein AB8G17_02550 [Gammaproteobacteria bacterium]